MVRYCKQMSWGSTVLDNMWPTIWLLHWSGLLNIFLYIVRHSAYFDLVFFLQHLYEPKICDIPGIKEICKIFEEYVVVAWTTWAAQKLTNSFCSTYKSCAVNMLNILDKYIKYYMFKILLFIIVRENAMKIIHYIIVLIWNLYYFTTQSYLPHVVIWRESVKSLVVTLINKLKQPLIMLN